MIDFFHFKISVRKDGADPANMHMLVQRTLDIVMGNFDVEPTLDQLLNYIEFWLVYNMNPTMLGQRCINYCILLGMQRESIDVGPTFGQPSTLRGTQHESVNKNN